MPPFEECTIDFLRDIFSGKKKALLNEDVKIVNVPRLPELSAIKLGKDVAGDPFL